MNYNRAALKREAKLAMSQSQASPYLMSLLFMVISLVSSLLVLSLNLPKGALTELLKGSERAIEYILYSYNYESGVFAGILSFLLNIMTSVVSYGVLVFCMAVYRRQPNSVGMLFDGFEMFFRILLLQIVTSIFVFLWSLLLVVPGIIAVYRYRFAPFLLIDNPHMSVLDCIRESKKLTKGYKGKLFVLDLSFILWHLLTALLFPLNIYVLPYYTTTLAGFYDMRLAHDRQQNQGFAYTDRSQNYGRFGD
jgi:uncharacterized membrane protein